jgi:hypothetical protein
VKFKAVAIKDRVSDAFSHPNFVTSTGSAIRSFGDEVRNTRENNPLNSHPDDFDLYLIGEYDDENASFTSHEPKQIALGRDYAK